MHDSQQRSIARAAGMLLAAMGIACWGGCQTHHAALPPSLTSQPLARTAQLPSAHVRPSLLGKSHIAQKPAASSASKVRTRRLAKRKVVVQSGIQQVAHEQPLLTAPDDDSGPFKDDSPAPTSTDPRLDGAKLRGALPDCSHPIDLANALALGGASNIQVALARERVIEAQAELLQARANWLPSLRIGAGYYKHDGQIQATEGDVIDAPRNSLFLGGGAGFENTPLIGGAGGPPRLFVTLSLADAFFEPLVAGRSLNAQDAARNATMNDELVAIASAYFDLLEAHGLLANADTGLAAAEEMAKLTSLFSREGKGSEADADRARTELGFWRQLVQEMERLANARSAELARLVRLNPRQVLVPAETKLAPVTLIDESMPREALLAQGLVSRPELAQFQSVVEAALARLDQERWRPWLPNVQVGASGGAFGGGPSSSFDHQKGRADVEVLAVWEWRNLGVGNKAQQRLRASQVRQAQSEAEGVRDRVAAEIVTAAGDVESYREQIHTALASTKAAAASYRRNLERVRQAEGLPLELLQSIRARGVAQDAYTRAVSDYNRAQFRLLRAIGQPPKPPAASILHEAIPIPASDDADFVLPEPPKFTDPEPNEMPPSEDDPPDNNDAADDDESMTG